MASILEGAVLVIAIVAGIAGIGISLRDSRKYSAILPHGKALSRGFTAVNVVIIVSAIMNFFTDPNSPFTQARPYLTFAAVVSLAALVGKFALSAAIVPILKAIPSAVAGIIVKIGWDKWQSRKPREPKPQS